MIRSMSAALSGMRTHQAMLDVVGNNIANVSTPGFKGSQAVFEDVLSQTLRGAGAPTANFAGTNPAQLGLGVRLVGTAQNMSQGALDRTGRTNDMGIQGDGFFITETGGQRMYTRAGNFSIDGDGRLSTQSGALVMGWQADIAGNVDTNQPIGPMTVQVGSQLPPVVTGNVTVGGNLPADAAVGTKKSTGVTIYDEIGTAVPVTITFTNTGPNAWTASAVYGAGATPVALTNNNLTFNGAGELTAPVGRAMGIAGGTIPGFPANVAIDLGGAATPGRLVQYAGTSTVVVRDQDGSTAGVLQSYAVSSSGTMIGYYSNGLNQSIGQVALAVFANPEGLERVAGNWRETPNSGLAQVGTALNGGRGAINPGTLEQSNVDLPQEFTSLIVAQRGFQANSRVITTSDEILQEIVNLKR